MGERAGSNPVTNTSAVPVQSVSGKAVRLFTVFLETQENLFGNDKTAPYRYGYFERGLLKISLFHMKERNLFSVMNHQKRQFGIDKEM